MPMSHSLLQCPLYNNATLTLNSTTRIITHASSDMIQLLEQEDLTGTPWPSKQDQRLCFTTLVKLKSGQRHKRLLTCEHINDNDPDITTIHCADLSRLNTTSAFFYALTPPQNCQFRNPTIIIRINSYGVIQSAFASTNNNKNNNSWMIGQPLMRFIHNDDLHILCGGLRQVTRYQQDDDSKNGTGGNWDNKDDMNMVAFDIRCNFDNSNSSLHDHCSIDGNNNSNNNNNSINHDQFYHFSTTVTSSHDILCVIRPAPFSTNHRNIISPQVTPTQPYSQRIPKTTTTTKCSSSSPSSSYHCGIPRVYSALIHLSQMVRSPYSKGKDMVNGLQQALWDAVEQGWMMLAHYLAVVVVIALQYYRMARCPSFWLETSELALRCLIAETTSKHELDRFFSWLDWSGVNQQPWFGSALDHGSEWLFSMSFRSHVYSF